MTAPALHTIPITRVPPPAPPAERAGTSSFRVLNGAVYFNGDCDACRPFCAAACCRGYSFVALTEEEANSGRYVLKEAKDDCACDVCTGMRKTGIRFALRKRSDGACFYLDGTGKCSIYEDRPETCRKYSCVNVAFRLLP